MHKNGSVVICNIMNTLSRKQKYKFIKDNIDDLADDQIIQTYDIVNQIVENSDNCETRYKQMLLIGNNLKFVDEINLDKIYSMMNNFINLQEKEILVDKNIDNDTGNQKMNQILLDILNKILQAMGKEQIYDICDFADIRRDELLDEKYEKIINDYKSQIFECGFNKHECKIYQINVKNHHLSILKGMLKQLGYSLCSKNYKKMRNKTLESYTSYTIRRKE
jgi:hypothetical protein